MSYGLRVWNSSGVVTLDIQNRITRFISQYNLVVGGGATVTVSVPGMVNDGTWALYYFNSAASCTIQSGSFSCFNSQTTTNTLFVLVFRC
jgi:hypothetical protein